MNILFTILYLKTKHKKKDMSLINNEMKKEADIGVNPTETYNKWYDRNDKIYEYRNNCEFDRTTGECQEWINCMFVQTHDDVCSQCKGPSASPPNEYIIICMTCRRKLRQVEKDNEKLFCNKNRIDRIESRYYLKKQNEEQRKKRYNTQM
jgi:hypothetical protein